MKFNYLIFLLLLSLYANELSCESNNIYVWSKSGLKLRTEPGFNASFKNVLPYGTKVEIIGDIEYDSVKILDSHTTRKKIDKTFWLYGRWVQIKSKYGEGFVFDAYLSKMPPIKSVNKSIEDWVNDNFKKKKIIKLEHNDERIIYDGGKIIFYSKGFEGGADHSFIFTNKYTFNDGFLLLNYFEDFAKIPNSNSYYYILDCGYERFLIDIFYEAESRFNIFYNKGVLVLSYGGNC